DMAARRKRHVLPGAPTIVGAEHAAVLGRAKEMVRMARVDRDCEHRALKRARQRHRREASAVVIAREERTFVAIEIVARADIETLRPLRRIGKRAAVRTLLAKGRDGEFFPVLAPVAAA